MSDIRHNVVQQNNFSACFTLTRAISDIHEGRFILQKYGPFYFRHVKKYEPFGNGPFCYKP